MRTSEQISQLSEVAQDLYRVAMQGEGIIHFNELNQGYLLRVNGVDYITDEDPPEVEAKKKTALDELVDFDFLVRENYDFRSRLVTYRIRNIR